MSMAIDGRQRRDDLVAQLSTLEHARSFSQLGCPPRRVSQRPIWESCCRAFSHNQVASWRVVAGGVQLRTLSVVCPVTDVFGYACPRCKTIMDEVVTIAPLESEPGLIGYECPACCYVTSVLLQSKGSQKRRSSEK